MTAAEQHMALARAEAGCPDDETLVIHCRELRADLDAERTARKARSRRPSSVIEAQLAAFLATLPAGVTAPPPGDFAAQLQWDAWQNHRQELEAELDQAIEAELAEAGCRELRADLDAERTARKALATALLASDRYCRHIHHEKADRHEYYSPCPVEARIAAALALAAKLP